MFSDILKRCKELIEMRKDKLQLDGRLLVRLLLSTDQMLAGVNEEQWSSGKDRRFGCRILDGMLTSPQLMAM